MLAWYLGLGLCVHAERRINGVSACDGGSDFVFVGGVGDITTGGTMGNTDGAITAGTGDAVSAGAEEKPVIKGSLVAPFLT